MKIDSVVYFKIFDPRLYTYGVDRPLSAMENLNATTLRNIIGGMELDQTLTSRDIINAQMLKILDEATRSSWAGITPIRSTSLSRVSSSCLASCSCICLLSLPRTKKRKKQKPRTL